MCFECVGGVVVELMVFALFSSTIVLRNFSQASPLILTFPPSEYFVFLSRHLPRCGLSRTLPRAA